MCVKRRDRGAFCFLNVWAAKMSWLGSFSFCVVALDFTLFVVLCFSLPFNTNPRIFALTTHAARAHGMYRFKGCRKKPLPSPFG